MARTERGFVSKFVKFGKLNGGQLKAKSKGSFGKHFVLQSGSSSSSSSDSSVDYFDRSGPDFASMNFFTLKVFFFDFLVAIADVVTDFIQVCREPMIGQAYVSGKT